MKHFFFLWFSIISLKPHASADINATLKKRKSPEPAKSTNNDLYKSFDELYEK